MSQVRYLGAKVYGWSWSDMDATPVTDLLDLVSAGASGMSPYELKKDKWKTAKARAFNDDPERVRQRQELIEQLKKDMQGKGG